MGKLNKLHKKLKVVNIVDIVVEYLYIQLTIVFFVMSEFSKIKIIIHTQDLYRALTKENQYYCRWNFETKQALPNFIY